MCRMCIQLGYLIHAVISEVSRPGQDVLPREPAWPGKANFQLGNYKIETAGGQREWTGEGWSVREKRGHDLDLGEIHWVPRAGSSSRGRNCPSVGVYFFFLLISWCDGPGSGG